MSGETSLTIIGNLVADPELRFLQSGAAVCNFTVASTPRFFDRQTQEWRDQDALFLRCSVFKEQAENVAEHLHKGNRVIVSGQMQMQRWEDKEGNKRSGFQLLVQEVGPSLRFAGAKVLRTERGAAERPPRGNQPPDDPWGGRPSAPGDDPPF